MSVLWSRNVPLLILISQFLYYQHITTILFEKWGLRQRQNNTREGGPSPEKVLTLEELWLVLQVCVPLTWRGPDLLPFIQRIPRRGGGQVHWSENCHCENIPWWHVWRETFSRKNSIWSEDPWPATVDICLQKRRGESFLDYINKSRDQKQPSGTQILTY